MQARRASEGTMFSVRIRSSVTKLDQVVSTNESILMPIGISGPRVTRRPSVTFPPLTRKRKIIQRSHIEERLPLMLATFACYNDHVTPALKQLHWLPVEHRIKYKLCTWMHQIHSGRAPQYLAQSVQSVAESSRRPGLRSANTADYIKRRTQLNSMTGASVTLACCLEFLT